LFNTEQLFQLARILGRPVEHFLGLDTGLTEDESHLLAAYRTIRNPEWRDLVLDLVKRTAARSQGAIG